jgi:hypothetical protein
VGEDDLEARLVLGHAALAVGEVSAVAEAEPGRRHGRAALGAAHPGRRRLRLDGAGEPAREGAQHGRGRRRGHRVGGALGDALLVPHLRHRRHPHACLPSCWPGLTDEFLCLDGRCGCLPRLVWRWGGRDRAVVVTVSAGPPAVWPLLIYRERESGAGGAPGRGQRLVGGPPPARLTNSRGPSTSSPRPVTATQDLISGCSAFCCLTRRRRPAGGRKILAGSAGLRCKAAAADFSYSSSSSSSSLFLCSADKIG